MLNNTEYYSTDILTCLLYVSSWLRAALAFLSSSSRLTVFCMYIVFFSSKSFTCRRKSPRSSNFFLYDSTWLSNLATLSEECLKGQICIKFELWKLTKLTEFKVLLHSFFLMQKIFMGRTIMQSCPPITDVLTLNCLFSSRNYVATLKVVAEVSLRPLSLFLTQLSYLLPALK